MVKQIRSVSLNDVGTRVERALIQINLSRTGVAPVNRQTGRRESPPRDYRRNSQSSNVRTMLMIRQVTMGK